MKASPHVVEPWRFTDSRSPLTGSNRGSFATFLPGVGTNSEAALANC